MRTSHRGVFDHDVGSIRIAEAHLLQDALMKAGAKHGIRNAGYRWLRSRALLPFLG
jgi:hypothetical protein